MLLRGSVFWQPAAVLLKLASLPYYLNASEFCLRILRVSYSPV